MTIQNALDRDPAVVAPGPGRTGTQSKAANPSLLRQPGAEFSRGVRFKM